MKLGVCTLGCKVNQYETNGMIQKFQEKHYEIVDFEEKADIYVINTCTVTNIADRKSRQMLSKARKNNQNALIIAMDGFDAGMQKLTFGTSVGILILIVGITVASYYRGRKLCADS